MALYLTNHRKLLLISEFFNNNVFNFKNMSKRNLSPGKIFYVYNKSIEGKDIFPCDDDKWRFLQALYFFNNDREFCNLFYEIEKRSDLPPLEGLKQHSKEEKRNPLAYILAYCLEEDGFHFLFEEKVEGGISKLMQRITTGYTKYFNNKYGREGPLFKGRFKSLEITKQEKLKYFLVHTNVIVPGKNIEKDLKERASKPEKVLDFANDYFWSTHQILLNKREAVIMNKEKVEAVFPSPKEYISYVGDVIHGREADLRGELKFCK